MNYNFDDNAYNSEVYKVKTCSNLFSINSSNLFFIEDDLKVVAINNVKQNIDKLNYELNLLAKKLNSKGIKLIVLPSPDKFDYYYDQIKNNSYPKPIFFNYFDKLEKTYSYINTKKLLTENGKNVEDMYIFDDTHWSPIAAKIIGNALNETIVADRINLK